MSVSDSVLAKPFITGLLRLPDLNSPSCLARYSGCWPAMIGLAGLPRVPSAVWRAAHTCVDIAWPLAMSGLAGALESAATTGSASEAVKHNRAASGDCMSVVPRARRGGQKPANFTMGHERAQPAHGSDGAGRVVVGALGPLSA